MAASGTPAPSARVVFAVNRVLVTGADGFIGRGLCPALLAAGVECRAAVLSAKIATGLPDKVSIVETGSIGGRSDWGPALEGVGAVVHLAARVHVMDDRSADPLEAFRRVNVEGTRRLALASREAGVGRFVFMSSVKVNGEGGSTPYSERDVPHPSDPYGISKLEAEEALRSVAAGSRLEAVVLRPPLVYGPGVKANFHRLFRLVDRGVPLPLAAVRNRRSFVSLRNLGDAILTALSHPSAAGQTYLVGDREAVSTPDLIRAIATALGRPVRLFGVPPSLLRGAAAVLGQTAAADRLLGSLVVDTSKIREQLGWAPRESLAQGMKATATWYKRTRHSSAAQNNGASR